MIMCRAKCMKALCNAFGSKFILWILLALMWLTGHKAATNYGYCAIEMLCFIIAVVDINKLLLL